ncbi:MAG: Gfo/Idh/MocA family oxidoreductase [Planctomycetota bacterium]|nr:Gfo/Idh/MocA family oxidoreductase [Planctomycetota bacterium]
MKIAFIGVGGIAGNYRASLRRLERPIAGVCDINPDRSHEIAKEESARAYTDHTEMLAEIKPDVVFVCIPPGAHTSQVADAARMGAAVFVAKPVALDLDTARRTRDAIADAGVINQTGYMARYSDMVEKAKEIVGDQALAMGNGRFLCRMGATHPWWGKFAVSGGQMLEQTTHVFDLLRYFLGDVERAQSFGIRGVSEGIADFEECTVCNLSYQSGAVGSITSSCVTGGEDSFSAELFGDSFYLKLVLNCDLRGKIGDEAVQFQGEETGYFRQVEQFVAAVEANDQDLVRSDYVNGFKSLAVTVAANQSLATGTVEKVCGD